MLLCAAQSEREVAARSVVCASADQADEGRDAQILEHRKKRWSILSDKSATVVGAEPLQLCCGYHVEREEPQANYLSAPVD